MKWTYRLVRHQVPASQPELAIHEVYFEPGGQPHTITHNPAQVWASDLEGVKWVLSKMLDALDKPILDADQFPKEEA